MSDKISIDAIKAWDAATRRDACGDIDSAIEWMQNFDNAPKRTRAQELIMEVWRNQSGVISEDTLRFYKNLMEVFADPSSTIPELTDEMIKAFEKDWYAGGGAIWSPGHCLQRHHERLKKQVI